MGLAAYPKFGIGRGNVGITAQEMGIATPKILTFGRWYNTNRVLQTLTFGRNFAAINQKQCRILVKRIKNIGEKN